MEGSLSFLNDISSATNAKVSPQDLSIFNVRVALLYFRAFLLQSTSEEQVLLRKEKGRASAADELCSVSIIQLSKFHSSVLMFESFYQACGVASGKFKTILDSLCLLYGLITIQDNLALFLCWKISPPIDVSLIRRKALSLLLQLREHVVYLTDAFNLSDYLINTPLGCYEGGVYEKFFAKVTSLNPPRPRHPYFDHTIKPLFERA